MPKLDKIFFWRSAHSFHRVTAHFVFMPKYRRRVLQGKIVQRIRELFFECCQVNDWFIHEMEILPDHLHFLLQLPPKDSLSKAAMFLKGGSSRILRKEFPELEEFLWGDSFWADGYFVETTGRIDEGAIREYIKNQRNQEVELSSGLPGRSS